MTQAHFFVLLPLWLVQESNILEKVKIRLEALVKQWKIEIFHVLLKVKPWKNVTFSIESKINVLHLLYNFNLITFFVVRCCQPKITLYINKFQREYIHKYFTSPIKSYHISFSHRILCTKEKILLKNATFVISSFFSKEIYCSNFILLGNYKNEGFIKY